MIFLKIKYKHEKKYSFDNFFEFQLFNMSILPCFNILKKNNKTEIGTDENIKYF